MQPLTADQLVSSPACIPRMPLEQILGAYQALGFSKFEAFTSWCDSHLDIDRDPHQYLQVARAHAMRFSSMHLPPVTDDFEATLARAVRAAGFAAAIGASVVLFKADSRANYIRAAGPFLDALQAQRIDVTPVLQNHKGTPITTLEDYRAVLGGIADPRMKTLLEVGHFQRVGVDWRAGCDLLGDRIALVHINEINADNQSVPFGTGLVDFPGLFHHLGAVGYRGDIVVELELATREQDSDRTLACLRQALDYLCQYL
jgi:sugar phosphate isomerase/epimerase